MGTAAVFVLQCTQWLDEKVGFTCLAKFTLYIFVRDKIKRNMEKQQLLIELGMIGIIFLVAGIAFFIYIKATPTETIPDEYFFKVREPNIRKKRQLKEEAKRAKKKTIEI